MKQPNILMICSDQHAARVTGAYGNRIVATPNLDKLAAEGCRFDSFYCNDPICVPSRMSLMTGRFPFRCEVTGNQSVLDSRFPTLAHIAVRGGWHAVLSGKMHFNGSDQRHGFLERLVGEPSTNALYGGANRGHEGPPFCHLGNCSRPDPLFHVGAGVNPFVAYDGAVTEATVRWLRQYATGAGTRTVPPFFLMVGFLLPHCPYIAPKELYEKYRAQVKAPRLTCAELDALHLHHRAYRKFIRLDDVPPENFDKAAAAYYGLVDQLDRNVGAVLDALQELGLLENTIVMYFSDHGEMLGRHGRWHKDCFHEEAARVPMFVRHSSQRLVSSVSEHCSLVDLMPTLCEWAGVKPPPGMDGVSLVPLLKGTPTATGRTVKAETYAYWDRGDWTETSNRMVRRGPWKLCYYGDYETGELFNLADDPGETRNLAEWPEYGSVLRELTPLLFEDGWSANVHCEIEAQLQAIGHTENIREYADMLRRDPLPIDAPDYWKDGAALRTRLEPE
jgi:choline-sulfatase